MPLYESATLTRDHLYEIRKTNRCQVCHGPLDVFLDVDSGKAFLACRDWRRTHHEGIEREAPAPFEQNIPSWREEMEEKHSAETVDKLVKYRGVTTLAKDEALTLFDLLWPEAPYEERLKAAIICHQYGLNPLMKHIVLIKYDKYKKDRETGKREKVGETWAVIQEIGSNRIIAKRRHHYSYLDLSPRRMTDDEQMKANGEIDNSRIWAITFVKDLDTGAEASGTGSWPIGEEPYGKEKGNTKLNMAKIRSERNALDRAFPAELPQGIEVMEEKYLEGEFKEMTEDSTSKPGVAEKTVPQAGGGEEKKGAGVSATKEKAQKPAEAPPAAAPAEDKITGNGFAIDMNWLTESVKALNWSEVTLRTFLSKYKVDTKGTIPDILRRLTREQAENFTKEINGRLENQPKLL
jgi:hypothetical protein